MGNKEIDTYKAMPSTVVLNIDTDDQEIQTLCDKASAIINRFISINPYLDIKNDGYPELLKALGRSLKANVHTPIQTLDKYWDVFTLISCICGRRPTLQNFAKVVNIHRDTFNTWITGERRTGGELGSSYTDTSKKWKLECESALYDECIRTGNIGCMFALKANYGYRDNVVINVTATTDLLGDNVTAAQLQARMADDDDSIDTMDDLD